MTEIDRQNAKQNGRPDPVRFGLIHPVQTDDDVPILLVAKQQRPVMVTKGGRQAFVGLRRGNQQPASDAQRLALRQAAGEVIDLKDATQQGPEPRTYRRCSESEQCVSQVATSAKS